MIPDQELYDIAQAIATMITVVKAKNLGRADYDSQFHKVRVYQINNGIIRCDVIPKGRISDKRK